jgi:hypothetical protein
MNQDRETFGSRLKEKREAKALSVGDVARITKIPTRSLELLEAGSFDRLPAEVFVRGFLKSYCRCVGLDSEETLRRYGEILYDGKAPKLASLAVPAAVTIDDPPADGVAAARPPAAPEEEPTVLTQALTDANRGTRRVSLTLAVIILVIVATLTLSLLLRRPSHVGDGLSQLGAVSETSVS